MDNATVGVRRCACDGRRSNPGEVASAARNVNEPRLVMRPGKLGATAASPCGLCSFKPLGRRWCIGFEWGDSVALAVLGTGLDRVGVVSGEFNGDFGERAAAMCRALIVAARISRVRISAACDDDIGGGWEVSVACRRWCSRPCNANRAGEMNSGLVGGESGASGE